MRLFFFDGIHTTPATHLNDDIVRLLAEVTSAGSPLFLKMPHLGTAALEETGAYDSYLIVENLAGGADTPREAFQLFHDVRKRGLQGAVLSKDSPLAGSLVFHSVPPPDRRQSVGNLRRGEALP